MKPREAAVTALTLFFVAAGVVPIVAAEEFYKWTDDQGRVHYSNRGSGSSADAGSGSAPAGSQGWESVLERQQGADDFPEKADAAINSLELQMTRKKRERSLAEDELHVTQARITRVTTLSAADLPALKEREAAEIGELRRLDLELGTIQMQIAKIRAMKVVGKDSKSQ